MIKKLKEDKYFRNKVIIVVIFISLLSIFSFSYIYLDIGPDITYNKFPAFNSSDRVLIVSPHPDDESLANSGIIRAALEANATVLVVMMTNGDGTPINITDYTKKSNITNFSGTIGDYRHLETIQAMSELGLNQSSIIFLGYPDGGLRYLFGNNWDYDNLYKSNSSANDYDHSPYNFSYELNAPYCGANVDKNLEEILVRYKPTVIFYPDDGDEHPDHWATSAFIRYAGIKTNYSGKTFSYLVHKGSWPTPLSYNPKLKLEAPNDVLDLDGTWYALDLDNETEIRKEKAINDHATQVSLMKNYLMSFVRSNEIFADYPTIDIVKVNSSNFTDGMPASSFDDLKYDSQTSALLPSTDLAGAGFTYDDNNNAYILLKTSGDINRDLVYNYHLRIYNGTDFKRIDVEVVNGTAQYKLMANNSIESNQTIGVQKQGDILIVTIPGDLFRNVNRLMMSTTLKDADKNTVDDMSWRVFEFFTEF